MSILRRVSILLLTICLTACSKPEPLISISVNFTHPGSKTSVAESNILYVSSESIRSSDLSKSFSGLPEELTRNYSMNVISVFCGEDLCKTDLVTLHWDAIGQFTHYTMADNLKLEKGQAQDFEPQDYVKLTSILSNKQSGLADLKASELINKTSSGSAPTVGADAVTGATVAINKQDYIEGAIWTCYTLWHFAQGELVSIVANITGSELNQLELLNLLKHEKNELQQFAISQLAYQQYQDNKTIAAVTEFALTNQSGFENDIIAFSKNLAMPQYQKMVTELTLYGSHSLRLRILQSLLESEEIIKLNSTLILALAKQISAWQDPQSLHSFLQLLQKQNNQSPQLIQALIPSLQQADFISARNVYYYLINHVTHTQHQQKLTLFQQLHAEKL
ncbi:hypothetical protein Q4601_06765 [Shewanella sp. 1_MG-2023]|uniref:hypothetical protein n=1 Tax=unclassified Shewanella TaxID=196818 RepID=UPI0026E1BDBF|nr:MULTISPECIES: hypothetical protein [unclassified Shewanella]MDO6611924.1 hypothetical protein [Shewanella sp. 7_MG-2023]MDO6771779.1 hypothetical protein [Shewanella sp. 2_MG-2023]MDO6794005.1 hypothetical protein [Shewanella sp. 1_MG-2023]